MTNKTTSKVHNSRGGYIEVANLYLDKHLPRVLRLLVITVGGDKRYADTQVFWRAHDK